MRSGAASLIALAAIVALAAFLRLSGLDRKSITHPEIYTPGIHLPAGISEPAERLTLFKILTGSIATETHPPAYYVFMLAWTRYFGTTLKSIRAPSALLGIACIPLLFWLGVLIQKKTAGLIAAALLAFSGFQIDYSQFAKMYMMACFLGLLSTTLLIASLKYPQHARLSRLAYAVIALIGVATHHFFWMLLFVQLLWMVSKVWRRRGNLPALLYTQLFVLILGCPWIIDAVYQGGMPMLPLSAEPFSSFIVHYLQFGFLFPNDFFSTLYFYAGDTKIVALSCALLLLGTIFFALGASNLFKQKDVLFLSEAAPRSYRLWFVAAVIAVLAIIGFVLVAKRFVEHPFASLRLVEVLTVLPLLLLAMALWIAKRVEAPLTESSADQSTGISGSASLVIMLAVIPLLIEGFAALHKPIFNPQGTLLICPYLLLVVATGVTVTFANRWVALALALVMVGLHVASIRAYREPGIIDYSKFASALSDRIQPGDLVFLRKDWKVTPIFYYLSEDKYQLVGRNYLAAREAHPKARIWVLVIRENNISTAMQAALEGYSIVDRIQMLPFAQALLYQPL